jgi:hypothetical protein
MRRLTWYLGVILCLMPAVSVAAEFSIDSTTYLQFQQYATPGFDKKFQAPATQYLSIDATKLGVDGLSLHFYGWGSATMGSTVGDQERYDGNLTYFYLNYRLPVNNAQIKAGRFFVTDGMEFNQVDGVSFRTDLPAGFTASIYGGAPSRLDYQSADFYRNQNWVGGHVGNHNNTGNWIVGGRVSNRIAGIMELGVSALYESGLGDITTTGTNPALVTSQHNFRQLVGGDIWLSPVRMVEITGHTNYNTTTSGIAENSYQLKLTPDQMVVISGDYAEQNPSSYFSTTNLPSLFTPAQNDKFRRYGGMVTVTPYKNLELSADFHHYTRNQKWVPLVEGGFYREYGNSNRYGVDVRMNFVENKARTGFSIHRVDGPNSSLSYNELRGYAMYDAHAYVISFDAIGQFYDAAAINTTSTAYELLLSAGYRFTPHLLLSGDISYGQNPEYSTEVKGLVKLVYNFTSAGKESQK